MKTYRIDSVAGKAVLAEGYKIFNWDWTGADNYCYADENGNIEGSIHTVDGKLEACAWGLHFCKNPVDCSFESARFIRADSSVICVLIP